MNKDEIEAAEVEILKLLKNLTTAETEATNTRDAALARIACVAVEALPEEVSPGRCEVARSRFTWPMMFSLNKSMNPSRTTIEALLRSLKLGEDFVVNLRGSAWKLTPQSRLVLHLVRQFRRHRILLKNKPKNWFSQPGDDARCMIEDDIRKLPELTPMTVDQWLDLILDSLCLETNLTSDAMYVNNLFITANTTKERVSKRITGTASTERIRSQKLQPEIKDSVRKVLNAISGRRKKGRQR